MHLLRLFLYFVAVAGMLLGIADSVALLLGGASRDSLIATGFTTMAVGLGAAFKGAGHIPLRASFVLLGLGGALPLLAGFAPVGAAFAAFLFLPLRALGAQLTAGIESHKFGGSFFMVGTLLGLLLCSHAGLGLPGFLVFWAVAGILQRFTIPKPVAQAKGKELPADPKPPLYHLVPNLVAGSALTLMVLFFLPYSAMFDSGAVNQDLRRWLTLTACFLACWFTFGEALANTKLRAPAAAAGFMVLGVAIKPLTSILADISTPKTYHRLMTDPRLREWSGSNAPLLPEESALYVPWLTLLCFGVFAAVFAFSLRTSLRGERTGASSWSPLLTGAGITLLLCGLLSSASLLPVLGTLAATMLLIAASSHWWNFAKAPRNRWIGIGVVAIAAAIGLRNIERPTMGYPMRDGFEWKQQVAVAPSAFEPGSDLHSVGWTSMPRRLTRAANPELRQDDMSYLYESRNRLSADAERAPAQVAEFLLAASLTADPQRLLMVGAPDKASVDIMQQLLQPRFSFACDPPQLVPLAMEGLSLPSNAPIQRSLASSDGPFDLVFLRNTGMWEERRSLLRVELLRQASVRLDAGGVCAFACAPEQLVPGMLPQWIAEFRRVFDKVSVFVLPDGMSKARILIAGSDDSAKEDGSWPIATGTMAAALERFGLPVNSKSDLLALEVQLQDDLGDASYWMFRGPFRPTESLLAPTAYRLIEELENVKRAAAVLEELAALETANGASLVDFFAAQLSAQEYSVHDTFLDRNPYAIETSEEALAKLLETARAYPDSASIRTVWQTLGVILVEQREIAWMDEYYTVLHEELGWSQPEILLVLAHAATESLDFELAAEYVGEILASAPNFKPAIELKKLVEAEETVPHDAHAGHNH
ncbi:MAG: hypothetical protein QF489_00735 [Planctomycetota bacterium]|jgi:hypothetical protein|nr:hypothetical protein [Planctomycetota bacterium]